MDKIQKVLIKAGRRDLAEEYYQKVSGKIKGPGIPDGTGPMKDDLACPCNKTDKEAAGNTSTFPCPECGTKVLENTGYCLKCKKKVESK